MKKIQEKYFKIYVRFIKENIPVYKKSYKDYSYIKNIIEAQFDNLNGYNEYFPHCYDIGFFNYKEYLSFIFDEFYNDISKALGNRLIYISNDNFTYNGKKFSSPKEYINYFISTCHLAYGLHILDNINNNVFNFSYEKTSYDLLCEYFFD